MSVRTRLVLSFFSLSLCFIDASSYGQETTVIALGKLQHKVDNNQFDLDKERISDSNLVWANLFFNYYKNPRYAYEEGFKNMILSVGLEYLIQVKVTPNFTGEFIFPKRTPDDNVISIKISSFDPSDIESKAEKLKRKYYDLATSDESFRLKINDEAIQQGTGFIIYCKLESFYFKEIIPFATLQVPNATYTYSINQPTIFIYQVPKEIESEKLEQSTGVLKLIEFTYANPPLVDYDVPSLSIKQRLKNSDDKDKVKFTLKSMTLGVNIGLKVDNLMK